MGRYSKEADASKSAKVRLLYLIYSSCRTNIIRKASMVTIHIR